VVQQNKKSQCRKKDFPIYTEILKKILKIM